MHQLEKNHLWLEAQSECKFIEKIYFRNNFSNFFGSLCEKFHNEIKKNCIMDKYVTIFIGYASNVRALSRKLVT